MPEHTDYADAQIDAAQEYSDLDTFTYVSPKVAHKLQDAVENVVDAVTYEMYFDDVRDIQVTALEALIALGQAEDLIQTIRKQVFARLSI